MGEKTDRGISINLNWPNLKQGACWWNRRLAFCVWHGNTLKKSCRMIGVVGNIFAKCTEGSGYCGVVALQWLFSFFAGLLVSGCLFASWGYSAAVSSQLMEKQRARLIRSSLKVDNGKNDSLKWVRILFRDSVNYTPNKEKAFLEFSLLHPFMELD